MDNAPVIEDVCLLPVVDGVSDGFAGLVVDDIFDVLYVDLFDAVVWTVSVISSDVVVSDMLDVLEVGLFVAPVVVNGGVVTVKNDAVVWGVVVIFAGTVENDFLDFEDIGLVVDSVVVGDGVATVKKDAVVRIVFVVVFAGVVEDVLLYIDNMLNVDIEVVGPVGSPMVVDGVVVAYVSDEDTRPVNFLEVVSVIVVDIGAVMSVVTFSCSINIYDTFIVSFILK